MHQSEINKLWPEYYKTMVEGDMVCQTLPSSGLWFVSVLCVVFLRPPDSSPSRRDIFLLWNIPLILKRFVQSQLFSVQVY